MKYAIVSACLLGVNCRYNGQPKANAAVLELVKEDDLCLIPVCPEQLGGLPTPRYPSEQMRGESAVQVGRTETIHVVNDHGEDVTENYARGAAEALRIAEIYGCEAALLKERSPSCGRGEVYDGSFTRKLVPGNGVTSELLLSQGIRVFGESEISELRNWLQEHENDGMMDDGYHPLRR